MDPRIGGYFLHERQNEGWDCEWDHVAFSRLGFEKQIYRVTIDADTPLTFVQDDLTMIRAGRPGCGYEMDWGSIPYLVQRFIRKEGVEYLAHDFVCHFGWLDVKEPNDVFFRPVRVSRAVGDRLLRTQSQCTRPHPRGWGKSTAIWCGVRVGAAFSFHPNPVALPDPYLAKPEWERPDVDPAGGYGGDDR